MDYPTESEETEIMTRSGLKNEAIQAVLDGADLETLQELTRQVIVSPAVTELARRLVRMSRPNTPKQPPLPPASSSGVRAHALALDFWQPLGRARRLPDAST